MNVNDMKKEYNWKRMVKLKSGHRLFEDQSSRHAGIAIADESGDYPHLTDDGVLWLDPARPAVLHYGYRGAVELMLPVLSSDGHAHHCIVNEEDAPFIHSLCHGRRGPSHIAVSNVADEDLSIWKPCDECVDMIVKQDVVRRLVHAERQLAALKKGLEQVLNGHGSGSEPCRHMAQRLLDAMKKA